MRDGARTLQNRPILGRDVFTRGDPQAMRIISHTRLDGDLYALMTAYIDQKKRQQTGAIARARGTHTKMAARPRPGPPKRLTPPLARL